MNGCVAVYGGRTMSFEDEIDDWVEEKHIKRDTDVYLKLNDNKITCKNLTIRRVLWEYILWTLGGKPQDYEYYTKSK